MPQKPVIKGKKIDKKQAANRHGKIPQTRKGKFEKPPKKAKLLEQYNDDKEVTKMINANNESTFAAKAQTVGGRLKALKAPLPVNAPKGQKGDKAAAGKAGEAMEEDA
mmetsp:Transcript_25557/g.64842  ORF Transcript_25557/g.64842 Transcript_25557/m.64842 type:complete len:108 (-) Transcript_25557:500-823(-)|eukprot:CAMPEP_0202864382 /NCGR_PEP_ID=MMETSP1391-20130828/4645_1 /ASSEMBLY_ACC=CAM_ASM_000867 /TAXON_ID=1034604 /ORGANISM="Chlamydomonas leiostraca, Strain SAG 11-49" /LENGTH=107 /DNA_ID=CAMNT_0049544115 /DNA_START=111 /DNA_END=434 /DNA_ORIENTATION=-